MDVINDKVILVSLTGLKDNVSISRAMELISKYPLNVLDLNQAVLNSLCVLTFTLEFQKTKSAPGLEFLKDLMFDANLLNYNIEYKFQRRSDFSIKHSAPSYIVTCVSPDPSVAITSQFLSEISYLFAIHKLKINKIKTPQSSNLMTIEFLLDSDEGFDPLTLKEGLMRVSSSNKIDVAIVKDDIYRNNKKLIVFDMDSTLIQAEVIDELAELCGVGEEVKKVTERAMNGELDFDQSLKERVSKLKGLDTKKMEQILENLPITPGVEDFLATVKPLGYRVAVISGGFSFFADAIKKKLGLDYAFSNELEIKDGKLTGKVVGPIINANQKAILTRLLAQKEGLSLDQVVAVGDGANDLPMLATAGLGVAFHAKEKVKKEAGNCLSFGPMTSLLPYLGIYNIINEKRN